MTLAFVVCALVALIAAGANADKHGFDKNTKTLLYLFLVVVIASGFSFELKQETHHKRSVAKIKAQSDDRIKYLKEQLDICKDKSKPKDPKDLKAPSLTPNISLSLEVIEELTEVSRGCNIAKVAVISKLDVLTDDKAKGIIKECKVFKLQKELQDG